jgi:hypothetical protein
MRVHTLSPSASDRPAPALQRRGRQLGLMLALVAAGLSTPLGHVLAQHAVEPVPEQMPKTLKPGKDGKVCQYEDVTGSRMKKRVCYASAEWEAREQAAKAMVREMDGKSIPRDANGG